MSQLAADDAALVRGALHGRTAEERWLVARVRSLRWAAEASSRHPQPLPGATALLRLAWPSVQTCVRALRTFTAADLELHPPHAETAATSAAGAAAGGGASKSLTVCLVVDLVRVAVHHTGGQRRCVRETPAWDISSAFAVESKLERLQGVCPAACPPALVYMVRRTWGGG